MNAIVAIQDYITKILNSVSGMKVLLLDKETTGIVSLAFSRSAILQKEVYLFERLDIQDRETMSHFKAVCLLRPTKENLIQLENELKNPKYGEYFLFFTNVIDREYIEILAEADQHEVVQQVHEYFADYFPINPDLYSLNINTLNVDTLTLRRTVEGVAALLLSLKKQPYIRTCGRSSKRLADALLNQMSQDPGLYDFRKPDIPPLLLLIDRASDPVTPLLSQWTYQAMIHELIGIKNNRVDMGSHVDKKKEVAEVVLSTENDPWWRDNMYLNFGDLGVAIKSLVSEYQLKSNSNKKIESLDDIKRFVEEFPEFKKMAGNVTKHVNLMGELNQLISSRSLLDVSVVEQGLATRYDPGGHANAVEELLNNPKILPSEKLRLVMLYALRYEADQSSVERMLKIFQNTGVGQEDVNVVRTLLKWAGKARRPADIYGDSMNFGARFFSDFTRGLKGVSNIYTSHKPLLHSVLDQLSKNTLPENIFPFEKGSRTKAPHQDVIIFMVGGATFEEAATVHQFNSSNNFRVILGGTSLLNSSSFIECLKEPVMIN